MVSGEAVDDAFAAAGYNDQTKGDSLNEWAWLGNTICVFQPYCGADPVRNMSEQGDTERILTDGEAVRESFREMILQPQSDIPHFRRFIKEIGWKIVEEEMILEDGKFYPMMKVVPGEKEHICADTPYTLSEWFGSMLLERKHPVLKEYLERELRIHALGNQEIRRAPARCRCWL